MGNASEQKLTKPFVVAVCGKMKLVLFLFTALLFAALGHSAVEIENGRCNNKVLAAIMKQVCSNCFTSD
jgi:hypothetical protein